MDLLGKVTPNGWIIEKRVDFPAEHTGGHFSDCYLARKGEHRAFLKALDIEKFDVSQVSWLLDGFSYESDLARLCREKKLARIVRVIESGQVERDPSAPPVLRNVPFLIFELAEGDIRESVDISKGVSNQWRFQVLHQTAAALMQLHKEHIAHQDLKPSNVLRFNGQQLKVGDLGRSSLRGKPAPHDQLPIPGAYKYAPFEQRYGYLCQDWLERRISVDVFHLGCLVVFAFTNIVFPEYVLARLSSSYKPEVWGDSYETVIDHVNSACIEALDALSSDFPAPFRSELIDIVRDLCHPNPSLRGRTVEKLTPPAGPLWLERYVTRFDRLEKRARLIQRSENA